MHVVQALDWRCVTCQKYESWLSVPLLHASQDGCQDSKFRSSVFSLILTLFPRLLTSTSNFETVRFPITTVDPQLDSH